MYVFTVLKIGLDESVGLMYRSWGCGFLQLGELGNLKVECSKILTRDEPVNPLKEARRALLGLWRLRLTLLSAAWRWVCFHPEKLKCLSP